LNVLQAFCTRTPSARPARAKAARVSSSPIAIRVRSRLRSIFWPRRQPAAAAIDFSPMYASAQPSRPHEHGAPSTTSVV
jgi:hypothetical protein